MIKKGFILTSILIVTACLAFVKNDYRILETKSFQAGESYTYKMKYGFLTIGKGKVSVHDKIFNVNNRPCYRVNIDGQTAGVASLWDVKNIYRSFIDTTAIIPHKFVYSARENNYKKDQTFTFDHKRQIVKRTEKEEIKEFQTPSDVQDMVSYLYLLRTIDFANMPIGGTMNSPLFFGDKLYEISMKYAGKEVLKTKFGKINTLKLMPMLPDNMLFDGKGAIRIYVTDDSNHVPIRVEVDFPFGTIGMEIIEYQNVKTPFVWS